MKCFNKKDVVESVAQYQAGYTKKALTEIVDIVFATIEMAIKEGVDINIDGVGRIKVKRVHRAERKRRNPYTGEWFMKPEHDVLKGVFILCKQLREELEK